MSAQHSEGSEAALAPRPAETPEALRRAISRITPSRLEEFDRRLAEASTEAQEPMDIGPLRVFCYRELGQRGIPQPEIRVKLGAAGRLTGRDGV